MVFSASSPNGKFTFGCLSMIHFKDPAARQKAMLVSEGVLNIKCSGRWQQHSQGLSTRLAASCTFERALAPANPRSHIRARPSYSRADDADGPRIVGAFLSKRSALQETTCQGGHHQNLRRDSF